MLAGVLALSLLLGGPSADAVERHDATVVEAAETVPPATVPPENTFNEFLPEDRGLGECISALPKPGCGSEARGGWRQGLILLVIVLGLGFIAWRVTRSMRRPRPPEPTAPPNGDPPSASVAP